MELIVVPNEYPLCIDMPVAEFETPDGAGYPEIVAPVVLMPPSGLEAPVGKTGLDAHGLAPPGNFLGQVGGLCGVG